MKKFILLSSLFPWLLWAQVSRDGTRETFVQRFNKLPATNGVSLRAETIDNLPDSTYTYYDGALHRRVGIKYNEDGWVALEEGYTDFGNDGLVNDDLKVEYTYTRKDGFFVQDGISYLKFYGDAWDTYARVVTCYNANYHPVRICSYFSLGNGAWELNQIRSTIEYNERGNPVVVMDSIPHGDGLKAIGRQELHYDGFDRIDGYDGFMPGETEGEWVAYEKVGVEYHSDMHTETWFKPDGEEWVIDRWVETRYDERGNVIAETEKRPDGNGGYLIQWSDTYHHVYLPDGTTSALRPGERRSSAVYPNPATDEVTVRLEDTEPAVATLVDLSGRVVGRQTVERQATLAVASLPPGVYLLKVKTAKGTDVHKLIVK
ncbi:MAG: T9SS type A sorting domain-containing protein [Tannerella sp.]|jgi:hypothetical protein|nr:T9SS type A sorting domain-containing protein [Tannerella sp.]